MCPIYIFREREKEVIRDRVSESILGHFLQERESGIEEKREKEKGLVFWCFWSLL